MRSEKVRERKREGRREWRPVIDSAVAAGIPYTHVYADGMMAALSREKSAPGKYSVAFSIGNPEELQASSEDPSDLRSYFAALLNGFEEDTAFQFFLVNHRVSLDAFLETAQVPNTGTPLDDSIHLYNEMIRENAKLGHNNMRRDRYIVFSLPARSPEQAAVRFADIEKRAKKLFAAYCAVPVRRLSVMERLRLVYDVYNFGEDAFDARKEKMGKGPDSPKSGSGRLAAKELVAPGSLEKHKNYLLLNGKVYARTLFLCSIPADMSENLIMDLAGVSSDMIYSALCEPLPTGRGFEIVKRRVAANSVIRNCAEKSTLADRNEGGVIRRREMLRHSEEDYFENQALKVFADARASGDRVFFCNFLIALFSDQLEDLDRDTKMLTLSASKFAFQIKPLDYQQEEGLSSVLPLGSCSVDVRRVLGVPRLCAMNPMDVQAQLRQKNGMYCGMNAINDNMIMINRRNMPYPCGLISGVRNAGKTYQVKREIYNTLISTSDPVFLIALPHEQEKYERFVQAMGGAAVSEGDFDPFRMVPEYGYLDEGIQLKKEYLCALFSAILNFRSQMSDRDAADAEKELERETEALLAAGVRDVRQAADLAERESAAYSLIFRALHDREHFAIEYLFGEKPAGARLTYFRVKDSVSLLVVLEHVWQEMLSFAKKSIASWVFLDSIDDVVKTQAGAKYLRHLLQLSDILQNPITSVVANSAVFASGELRYSLISLFPFVGYYKLLNQGPVERRMYADALNIQPSLLPFLTNSGVGKGLIVSSSMTVPFTDNMRETAPAREYEKINGIFR